MAIVGLFASLLSLVGLAAQFHAYLVRRNRPAEEVEFEESSVYDIAPYPLPVGGGLEDGWFSADVGLLFAGSPA